MCTYSISVDDALLEQVRPAFSDNAAIEAWIRSQMNLLLIQLAEEMSEKRRGKPQLSKRLRGIVHAPADFDYKQELAALYDA